MSLIISAKKYTPAPEGLHQAVCVDVVDLGVVETNFGKKEMVRIVWELSAEMEDGRPFIIGRRYTPSLHEKARLHKDLKAWRGRAFTTEELVSFDLEKVIGAPCQILVQHEERDGTIYGNIAAITKAEPHIKLQPSGHYIRVKDRPEQASGSNGGSGFQVPVGEDEPGVVPF